MELFENYESGLDMSIYDVLRESLDDELAIVRSMHSYEMKTIHMESAEFDGAVITEAAGDIFAKIKVSVKQFFDRVIQWVKNVIDTLRHNAKAYKEFAAKHYKTVDAFDGQIKPEGYKLYNYEKGLKTVGDFHTNIEYVSNVARHAAMGDVNAIKEIEEYAEENRLTSRRVYVNDSFSSTDQKDYIEALRNRYRGGDELDVINKDTARYMLTYLWSNYTNYIKFYEKCQKNINDVSKKLLSEITDIEKEAKKSGDSTKDGIKAVNKLWAIIKQEQSDGLTAMNVYRDIVGECAGVAKKVVTQVIKASNNK